MGSKYTNTQISKNITESKLTHLNEILPWCELFFVVSQFRQVEGLTVSQIEMLGFNMTKEMPKCGVGQKVYGVLTDGQIVKLTEIIDSSD